MQAAVSEAETIWLGKGDVAVVFDDQAVGAAVSVTSGFGDGEINDLVHWLPVIVRRARKRKRVDDGDDRLAPAENLFDRIRLLTEYGLCPWCFAHDVCPF